MFRKFLVSLSIFSFGILPQLYTVMADETAPKKTAVLLVSLDPKFYPHGIPAWFHDYSQYPTKLEATFKSALANSNLNLQVIQNATRYDLFEALQSSDNVAIFWVSHAAPSSFSKPGVSVDPELVDVNGGDVKALFKSVNPGIQWISLVACDSDVIINWLHGQVSQQSTMQGFDKPIDANKGLKQAISLSAPSLAPENEKALDPVLEQDQRFPITVHRSYTAQGASALLPAVTIENNGVAIAALPEATVAPGETVSQEAQTYLTGVTSETDTQQLRLKVESGLSTLALPSGFQMGEVEFRGGWDGASWKQFSKPDGTPLGVTERLFLFDGTH